MLSERSCWTGANPTGARRRGAGKTRRCSRLHPGKITGARRRGAERTRRCSRLHPSPPTGARRRGAQRTRRCSRLHRCAGKIPRRLAAASSEEQAPTKSKAESNVSGTPGRQRQSWSGKRGQRSAAAAMERRAPGVVGEACRSGVAKATRRAAPPARAPLLLTRAARQGPSPLIVRRGAPPRRRVSLRSALLPVHRRGARAGMAFGHGGVTRKVRA